MNNQNESGRSMMEMLGVLGVMGIIMYAAVSGISFGIEMYRINATFTEIENLSKNMISVGSFLGNYANVVNVDLCGEDYFPCRKDGAGNFIMENQWNGSVTVECRDVDCHSFKITYADVPKVACQRLVEDGMFQYVHIDDPSNACVNDLNNVVFVQTRRGDSL